MGPHPLQSTLHRSVAVRLLLASLEPTLQCLHAVTTNAHVDDPHHEFFISHDPSIAPH